MTYYKTVYQKEHKTGSELGYLYRQNIDLSDPSCLWIRASFNRFGHSLYLDPFESIWKTLALQNFDDIDFPRYNCDSSPDCVGDTVKGRETE